MFTIDTIRFIYTAANIFEDVPHAHIIFKYPGQLNFFNAAVNTGFLQVGDQTRRDLVAMLDQEED